MDLKKCWGLKNVWEVCQQILCINLKKKIIFFWGGGGYAQIFHRLEKCWGGGGYANKFMDLKNVWGGYAKIF